jgi:hypothetical protein
MTNCCQTNTCVELVPSTCVRYTGTPTVGNLIDKQAYCDPYLNDIIKLLDDNLSDLDVRVGLNKTAFDNTNNACGLNPVINTAGLTVKNDKYYSSEVILRLTSSLCQVRSSLNYLTSQDINVLGTGAGNIHWQDLELKGSLLTLVQTKSICLGDNYCSGNEPKTLGQLLENLINKICNCCP